MGARAVELVEIDLLRGPLDGEVLTIPADPLKPPETLWMAEVSATYVRGAPCMCLGHLRWFYIHEESV